MKFARADGEGGKAIRCLRCEGLRVQRGREIGGGERVVQEVS